MPKVSIIEKVGAFGYLLARLAGSLRYVWADRRRVIAQMEQIGVRSLPLVLLVGLFAGAIIAWQAAYQFRGMISLSVLGGQVTRVVMMEMAPVLTALVISGRIGASMAAEIGSMKMSEQLDALSTLSIDPVRYVGMPRFAGLACMMPILTLMANLISVLGAFAVSRYFLDLTSAVFFQSVRNFFTIPDLTGGLIKSMVFGVFIGWIGCFQGFRAQGGAKGLGKATIAAFVYASISILAIDFMVWIILF
jgi:phospholipid/cholesterol/gamma-HCH transport system permease protein